MMAIAVCLFVCYLQQVQTLTTWTWKRLVCMLVSEGVTDKSRLFYETHQQIKGELQFLESVNELCLGWRFSS